MTEEEYLKRKPELDRQYKIIDDEMDRQKFTEYKDGAGDFGKRRFIDDDNRGFEVMIMDMVPEYWDNSYPDHQFYGMTKDARKWVPINTIDELRAFISNPENSNYTFKGVKS